MSMLFRKAAWGLALAIALQIPRPALAADESDHVTLLVTGMSGGALADPSSASDDEASTSAEPAAGPEDWHARLTHSARRVAALQDRLSRDASHSLRVDLGNLVSNRWHPAATGSLDLAVLHEAHYDALVPYQNELQLSPSELATVARQVPLLAANLTPKVPAAPLFRRSLTVKVGDRTIGLVGVVDDQALSEIGVGTEGSPWEVEDPIEAAKDAVSDLSDSSPDAIVVVTNVHDERLFKLREALSGVAAIVAAPFGHGGSHSLEEQLVLSDEDSSSGSSAMVTGVTREQLADLRLEFKGEGDHPSLSRVTSSLQPLEMPDHVDGHLYDRLSEILARHPGWKSDLLLPSWAVLVASESVGPPEDPWKALGPAALTRLEASTLRRLTHAEVAMVRTLSIRPTSAAVTDGELTEWLSGNDRVVTMSLKGSEVKDLAQLSGKHDDFLGFAGYQPDKEWVDGRPLNPDGAYRVVTTDRTLRLALLAETVKDHPVHPWSRPGGRDSTPLREALMDDLARLKREQHGFSAGYLRELRARLQDEGLVLEPKVTLGADDLSFNLNDVQVFNGQSYARVRNTQINTLNSLTWGGSGKLRALYDTSPLAWENRATLGYNRVVLQVRNLNFMSVSSNAAQGMSELRAKAWSLRVPVATATLVPYVNGTYTTAFPPPDWAPQVPLPEELVNGMGLVWYPGSVLRELRAGAIAKSDFVDPRQQVQPGFQAGAVLEQKFGDDKATVIDLTVDYKNYLPTPLDNETDLGMTTAISLRCKVPIWDGVQFSVGLDSLLFQGKLPTNSTLGVAVTPTVGLSFSTSWKPQYGVFY
jgi:hypothetical protein